MDNTIGLQGRFVSDGNAKQISIRSDFDFIEVLNESVAYAAGADTGAKFEFQRGQTNGRGTIYVKTTATNALQIGQIAANAGFVMLDTSGEPLAAEVAVSAIGNTDTTPTITTGSTAGVSNGSIVRLYGIAAGKVQLNGYDFAVNNVMTDTSFDLAAPLATATGAVAATGFYRLVKFNPLFYPRHRSIINITSSGQSTVVTMSVPSGYKIGEVLRFVVPTNKVAGVPIYGTMAANINGKQATVTAVNDALGTQTVTVDLDSSSFGTFAFPTTAQAAAGRSKALVVPMGMDTAEAISQSQNILADAVTNEGMIGVQLQAGTLSPAGVDTNVIYWRAFKMFSVDNN